MKKTIFMALLAIFSLSATTVFAAENNSTTAVSEATLTAEEISNYKSRVEEIRDMDKSEMTSSEKKELKSELKDIKKSMRSGPYVYIGGTTLILLIILLIILL